MGSSEPHHDNFWQKLSKVVRWLINAVVLVGNLAAAILALIALYALLTGTNLFGR